MMTWDQSLEAFAINKQWLPEILKTTFNSRRNKSFLGRCMACSENMKTVKRTCGVQLCEICWDYYFKGNQ